MTSIGVVQIGANESISQARIGADSALYWANAAGRKRPELDCARSSAIETSLLADSVL